MTPLWRKRDGSIVEVTRNPDGSIVEIPIASAQPVLSAMRVTNAGQSFTVEPSAPGNVRQFLREIGRRGGQARAARHSREDIAEWGRRRHKSRS